MPDSLLAVLKVVFLGLLYLFFVRVIRAVWIELREPKIVQVAAMPPAPPAQPTSRPKPSESDRSRGQSQQLVIVEPAELKGRAFDLGDELTVGRAPGCGVALPDDTFISQVHARVFRRDGVLYVEDLGSTNGTFLNRQRVSSAVPVHKGDRLQVGKSVLELNR